MRGRLLLLAALLMPWGCSDDGGSSGPTGPLKADELYQACLRTAACGIKPQPRLSNCVDYYHTMLSSLGLAPLYDALYRCVNRGADCVEIFDCFGSHPAAGSCDGTYIAHCDGKKASTCDLLDHRVYVYDCGLAGLDCEVKQGTSAFEASCTLGSCDASYEERCDNDRKLGCYEGVIVVNDCAAAQGLTCVADGDGARCTGTDPESCDVQAYVETCQGRVALTCVGGQLEGQVSRHDCALQMVDRACAAGRCVPAGNDCSDAFNRCEGDTLQACLDGRWQTFDCVGLGMKPCETRTNGASCGKPAGS